MLLSKYNPIGNALKLFGDDFVDIHSEGFLPKANFKENKDSYSIELDVPGISKDDIKINIENDIITISGERNFKDEENKDGYYRVESSYGSFKRSFELPNSVDMNKISAKHSNGILHLDIPKSEDKKIKAIKIS